MSLSSENNKENNLGLVPKLVSRTKSRFGNYDDLLGDSESIMSFNKVTGYSVNFPIALTCQPTGVCANRCYFAKGGSSWPAALKKQIRLYNSTTDDPRGTADRLISEINRKSKKPDFMRWNGGGDLFPESVEMLHYAAEAFPDIPFWVVTRIPKYASMVKEMKNVYVHFSLDGKSLSRMKKYEKFDKKSQNYFYSYQCDKGEMPSKDNLKGVSVVFFDGYVPTGDIEWIENEIICPLNTREDITGTCGSCRRCFDDSAVNYFKKNK